MEAHNILLIKSHSMGIGDLLRSSAAWSVLKQRWPNAKLHLLMLSKHPGYPTQDLIAEHHLLHDSLFVSISESPTSKKKKPAKDICKSITDKFGLVPFDLIIDCEPYGLRSTLLARWIARRWRAKSVGIGQFPLRALFYDYVAPSVQTYAALHGLTLPMDYTERDFVALAALGLERNGTPIILEPTKSGLLWKSQNLSFTGLPKVILNIGCGTPDALVKRPQLESLVTNMLALLGRFKFELHLSGAAFESEVNQAFTAAFKSQLQTLGLSCPVYDWAGKCTLSELTGLLEAGALVVSTDSGPYHMAVALGVPTVCWFNFATLPSQHKSPKVGLLVNPSAEDFVASCQQVLNSN